MAVVTAGAAPSRGPPHQPRYARNVDVPFYLVAKLWEDIIAMNLGPKDGRLARKQGMMRRFLATYLNRASPDTFQLMRLLCPDRDRVRGHYQMKEAGLASNLIKACGQPAKGELEQQLVGFQKHVTKREHSHFHTAAYGLLLTKFCNIAPGDTQRAMRLSVGELNTELDRLADSSQRAAEIKVQVLKRLLDRTTPIMFKWILCIILGDVPIGVKSPVIIKMYHPDAEDMWSLTQDLQQICEKLRDPLARMLRKDVEPGCAVDPMKAERAVSTEQAFSMMQGKPYIVEIKMDGERLLLHRSTSVDGYGSTSEQVKYTSRRC